MKFIGKITRLDVCVNFELADVAEYHDCTVEELDQDNKPALDYDKVQEYILNQLSKELPNDAGEFTLYPESLELEVESVE